MKMTDYPSVQVLKENNIFILDGPDGTKQITAKDLAEAIATMAGLSATIDLKDLPLLETGIETGSRFLIGLPNGDNRAIKADDVFYELLDAFIPLEQRRKTFRGKNLGSSLTKEQAQNITNGTFKGFFIGDYWEIDSRIWRIVDINYWIGCGDEECTTPHLVIMPDHTLYNQAMNSSGNVTTGAYVSSEMYRTGLNSAKATVNSAFGAGNILSHKEYLQNAVTSGYASAGAWYASTVELPNECMMYGSYIFTPAGNGSVVVNRYTINKSQLALMQMHPKWINPHRENQWLRDVVSTASFARVDSRGAATSSNASNALGVRVVFGVTGAEAAAA